MPQARAQQLASGQFGELAQLVGPQRGATAAQLKALADASQRADELVHKKINDTQDDVGTRVDLLAEPDLSLAARRSGTAPRPTSWTRRCSTWL